MRNKLAGWKMNTLTVKMINHDSDEIEGRI